MRWMLLVLAACSTPGREPAAPDAAADAPPADAWDGTMVRYGNAVAIGAHQIAWTDGVQCALEGGCAEAGPMVTVADATGHVSTLLTSAGGGSGIAGDETGWFYVDVRGQAVVRVDESVATLRFSTLPLRSPDVITDASYVYWTDQGAVMRASRTGDGSDATAIAHPAFYSGNLQVVAGEPWWQACSGHCEVYRATSDAPIATDQEIVGADDTGIYLVGAEPDALVHAGTDGTMTTLFTDLTGMSPVHVIHDGNELFWSSDHGIYRTSPDVPSPTLVVDTPQFDTVFGVTPTEIVYGFTSEGYQSVPR